MTTLVDQPDVDNASPSPEAIDDGTNIYIGDDLTKTRAKLAYQARQAKRNGEISDTWVFGSKIMIKTNFSRIFLVNSADELLQKIRQHWTFEYSTIHMLPLQIYIYIYIIYVFPSHNELINRYSLFMFMLICTLSCSGAWGWLGRLFGAHCQHHGGLFEDQWCDWWALDGLLPAFMSQRRWLCVQNLLMGTKWCIYVSTEYTSTGWDGGLSPAWRQAINGIIDGLLLTGPLRMHFSET